MAFKKEKDEKEILAEQAKKEEEKTEEKVEETLEEVEESEEELTPTEDDEKIKKAINEKRNDFQTIQKKNRKLGIIVSVGILVFLVASFVLLLTLSKSDMSWISYVCLGVTVVLLVIGYIFQKIDKKKAEEEANKYLDFIFQKTNEYIYKDEKFTDLSVNPTDKENLAKDIFLSARMYKDIKTVKGRNLTSVTYKENTLTSLDVAGSILVKGRPSPRFLGKLYVYPFSGEEEVRALFQLKGKELSCPVDEIADLTLVEGNEKYVYYVNDERFKNALSSKAIGLIKSIKIDKDVIDCIVAINKNVVYVGIDYSDEFEAIATDKEFTLDNTYKAKKDLEKVLKIIDEINKK